jgi:hypothetical protein
VPSFVGDSSTPSARDFTFLWVDKDNMLWLYGGNTKALGPSNDLWSYNLTKNDGVFVFINALPFNTGTQGVPVWPGSVAGGAYWYTQPQVHRVFALIIVWVESKDHHIA